MLIHDLVKKKLISPPKFLPDNTHYLCVMGSSAYGASNDDSDQDLYGFCTPPREDIFPHLRGEIQGFGIQKQRFEQWSEHHIRDGDMEYDFAIYGIVKFFQLCMENNPNMCDSMFVPARCVKHVTRIGQIVLNNRNDFLHKGSYHKFRGYAFAQLAKLRNKTSSKNPKRAETITRTGYDSKFAYHLVRLSLECEQILTEHTLTLDRNGALLREIRNGDWTLDQIEQWFSDKEVVLEELFRTTTLRDRPDQDHIRNILFQCIEEQYGAISKTVMRDSDGVLRDMQELIDRYKGVI